MKEIIRIQSIHDVHSILEIKKPNHPLVSVIDIDDRIVNFDYGEAKYVFDFYQISMKQGFEGSFLYGRNSYDFEEGTLTFIKPGQTIEIEKQEQRKGSSGWTLLFHPDLIRKSELGKTIDDYGFFDYNLKIIQKIRSKMNDYPVKVIIPPI